MAFKLVDNFPDFEWTKKSGGISQKWEHFKTAPRPASHLGWSWWSTTPTSSLTRLAASSLLPKVRPEHHPPCQRLDLGAKKLLPAWQLCNGVVGFSWDGVRSGAKDLLTFCLRRILASLGRVDLPRLLSARAQTAPWEIQILSGLVQQGHPLHLILFLVQQGHTIHLLVLVVKCTTMTGELPGGQRFWTWNFASTPFGGNLTLCRNDFSWWLGNE